MPDQTAPSHLDPDTIAAYAERRLVEADRLAAERHLAACAECRREVAHVVRVLRPKLPSWVVGGGTVAAAAAIVFLALQLGSGDPESSTPSIRDRADPDSPVEIVSPDSVHADEPAGLRFVWRPLESGTRYEFSLADEAGSRIFSAGFSDTVLTLPDSVVLERERIYQWFVDALLPDGRSATSGVRFLRIPR